MSPNDKTALQEIANSLKLAVEALTIEDDEEFVEAVHDIEDGLGRLRPLQSRAWKRIRSKDVETTSNDEVSAPNSEELVTNWYEAHREMACGSCGCTWEFDTPYEIGTLLNNNDINCPNCGDLGTWCERITIRVASGE